MKYLVMDQYDGGWDCTSVFDSLKEANAEARAQWEHLSNHDRKRHHIEVGTAEKSSDFYDESDLELPEEEFNWKSPIAWSGSDACFDSAELSEPLEGSLLDRLGAADGWGKKLRWNSSDPLGTICLEPDAWEINSRVFDSETDYDPALFGDIDDHNEVMTDAEWERLIESLEFGKR